MTGGTLLQAAFIVLKLCGVINWPWVWVVSPTWIAAIVSVVLLILALFGKVDVNDH